jgi:uncharacterized protein (DUF952 family)
VETNEQYIYHFTERETFELAQSQGYFKPNPFDRDGFIHCSTRDQVLRVANFIAPKDGDLVLLEIDTTLVKPEIVYENLDGGEILFPHVYGTLPLHTITTVWRFAPNNNGEFEFPSENESAQ